MSEQAISLRILMQEKIKILMMMLLVYSAIHTKSPDLKELNNLLIIAIILAMMLRAVNNFCIEINFDSETLFTSRCIKLR